MKQYLFLFWILIFCKNLNGQNTTESLSGQISFVSSQNVYVKFKSTAGISVGDTLFLSSNGVTTPILKVNNLSSSSCVCTNISTVNLSTTAQVIAKPKIITIKPEIKIDDVIVKKKPVSDTTIVSTKKPLQKKELNSNIKGSISINSYSDFSNTAAKNSQRFRYTFSLDAKNINNSNFSVESYMSFNHKYGEWGVVKSDVFDALKIYNLSVRYDPNKTTQISLGRKMNSRITSIGAIDGLQIEKTIKGFTFGGVVGTRPDYMTYGFNSKLFQYGAYLSLNSKSINTYTESSLAFMQQMNNSKIDRRFVYFQHSNSIIKDLYFFSTLEIDLYKVDSLSNKPQNTFNPVGGYLSLRYRISKKFTISGSYDARKNIIFYETYKTFIDRVLETELRQGFRLQSSYQITSNLIFGLQSGYRFSKTDPKPSKNAYGYLTYNQIPGLNISATLSATYLESSYMTGKIIGMTVSRELFKGKVQSSIGYRYVNYNLTANQPDIIQNIGEMSLSWQLSKNIFFSLNYEGTYEQKARYNRFYLQIRKRF